MPSSTTRTMSSSSAMTVTSTVDAWAWRATFESASRRIASAFVIATFTHRLQRTVEPDTGGEPEVHPLLLDHRQQPFPESAVRADRMLESEDRRANLRDRRIQRVDDPRGPLGQGRIREPGVERLGRHARREESLDHRIVEVPSNTFAILDDLQFAFALVLASLGSDPLADVSCDGDDHRRLVDVVERERLDHDLHRNVATILPAQCRGAREHRPGARIQRVEQRLQLRLVEFGCEVRQRHLQQLLARVAHLRDRSLIHVDHAWVRGVEDVHGVVRRIEHLLNPTRVSFGIHPFGHVADRRHDAESVVGRRSDSG